MASAYFFGFHLGNSWRMLNLLDRYFRYNPSELKNSKEIDIIDLGAGTGSATHSVCSYLMALDSNKKVNSFIVDRSKNLLDKAVLVNEDHKPKKIVCSLEEYFLRPNRGSIPQIYILSYICNELLKDRIFKKKFLNQLKSKTLKKEEFYIFLIDSAHENFFDSIVGFRNELVDHELKIHFPCPSSSVCPASIPKKFKDRCFSNPQHQPPSLLKKHQEKYKNTHRYDFSGYVFSSIKPEHKIPEKVIGQIGHQNFLVCNGKNIENTKIKISNYSRCMDFSKD